MELIESLGSSGSVGSLETEIMNHGQDSKPFGRQPPSAVIDLGQIAVSFLHGGRGTLKLLGHPQCPLRPLVTFLLGDLGSLGVRGQNLLSLACQMLVVCSQLRLIGLGSLGWPVEARQQDLREP